MTDIYANFEELQASETSAAYSIEYRDTGSSLVIVAPHGGGIEWGTSEIARAIAGKELSYYLFEGRKAKGNDSLHITSSNFNEPTGLALIRSSEIVLTIHGEKSESGAVYLGGRNTSAIFRLCSLLTQNGYDAREHENPDLQGQHKRNICNMGRGGSGVQLELSAGLRGLFFAARNRAGRQHPTAKLFEFSSLVIRAMRENAL